MLRTTAVLLLLSLNFATRAVPLDASKGKTQFLAIGRPSAIKINGKGSGPSGDLKFTKNGEDYSMNGNATVDLTTFETGIGMRDRHMKEKYLEVERFKNATLKFENVKMPAKLFQSGGEAEVAALLELHGKTNPVKVKVKVSKTGETLASQCQFKIKLSEFGIEVPKFSGITVADEIEVTTNTELPHKTVSEGI